MKIATSIISHPHLPAPTPRLSLHRLPSTLQSTASITDSAPTTSTVPEGSLYNAMIAPLTGLAVKAILWYQGENNSFKTPATPAAEQPWIKYAAQFPLMIKLWVRPTPKRTFCGPANPAQCGHLGLGAGAAMLPA
jgi:hypothetical protein